MKCIELFGMSRAGKTTQINVMLEKMRSEGVNALDVKRPMISFRDFKSPAHFHNYYLDHLLREVGQHKNDDVIILDRGFYDRIVLSEFDYDKGQLTREEYLLIRNRIQQSIPKVDLGFLLLLSPEESLKRFESQRAQNLDFSHLNVGMIDCDEFQNLSKLYEVYSALSPDKKLKVIDAKRPIAEVSRDIMGGIYG